MRCTNVNVPEFEWPMLLAIQRCGQYHSPWVFRKVERQSGWLNSGVRSLYGWLAKYTPFFNFQHSWDVFHHLPCQIRTELLYNVTGKPLSLPAPTSTTPPKIKKHCFVGQNAHVHGHGFHLATHSLATCALNVTTTTSSSQLNVKFNGGGNLYS